MTKLTSLIHLPTRGLKNSIIVIFYLLVWYSLLRLGFFIANHRFFIEVDSKEIILSFIYGLRFDLSAILMINGLILLLYNLPWRRLTEKKWFRIFLLILFWSLNLLFITLNLSDYGYFPATQRRLMSEIYVMPVEILRMLPTMWSDFYYLFIALGIIIIIFGLSSWYLLRRLNYAGLSDDASTRGKFHVIASVIVSFVLLILLIVYGIKGGIQRKPIRQASAFWSNNRIIGYLTLNSSFTVIKSLFQASIQEHRLLPYDRMLSEVTKMIYQKNEEMIDKDYPFLRRVSFNDDNNVAPKPSYAVPKPRSGEGQPNIVVFIMESFTAEYIGSISGKDTFTPFFDSLAEKGMLFTNFLAQGQRTVQATPSIIDSIPGFYITSSIGKSDSFVESQSETNNFIGLGNVLKKAGYTTAFHHGANTGALGLDVHSRLAGFMKYFGKEDFLKAGGSGEDAVWGIWDEEFFLDSLKRMDRFSEPFCSVIFSLTSHEPCRLPPHRASLFEQYIDETKFQKALRYSDYSLRRFFESAIDKPWYKNTIFIITADHTTHTRPNDFRSAFHIPLLIYSEGLIKPGRYNQVGVQVDILPTIVDLLRINTVYSSMGRSILPQEAEHYVVISLGPHYAICTDRFILLNDLEKNIGLYEYYSDPFFKIDLQLKYPDVAQDLKTKLYAYTQAVTYALAKDRICRRSDIIDSK